MTAVSETEHAVLQALKAGGKPTIDELAARLKLDQSKVSTAVKRFSESGWAAVTERAREELRLADGAVDVGELPERQLLGVLREARSMAMQAVSAWARERKTEILGRIARRLTRRVVFADLRQQAVGA